MNTLAVISDIHGNLPALEAVLADIARSGAEVTVNLGDILSGPLWPSETADRLMALNLPTIAGNHERQVLTQAVERMGASDAYAVRCLAPRHREWLLSLPPTLRLTEQVLCVHGTPQSDLVYWLDSTAPGFGQHGFSGMRPATAAEVAERLGDVQAEVVLCGHTHVPRAATAGTALIVNPGSVGLQAYEGDLPHPHIMEIGSPHARWALLQHTPAGWQVTQHAVPYDWASAAAQAERNGRPEWAHALRTGRMPAAKTTIAA